MRIAWIGPMPNGEGGASGVSNQLLRELDTRDVQIDCYFPGHETALPSNLRNLKNVRFICGPSSWEWDRWYSRNRLIGFITGQISNLRAENRLAHKLVETHKTQPYDVIYQFSHIELSALKRFRKKLPPIVLHPSVHAKGELRWHRAEAHLSKASEPMLIRWGARALLLCRTSVQKRHIRYPDKVLALSANFAQDLIRDYHVPPNKISIVPNPIDLQRFTPDLSRKRQNGRYLILFVSRIAVRKGVEMIVDLSHRLDDLADKVEIQIVGDKSQWSDYTALLKDLNPRTASFVGTVSGRGLDMVHLYQEANILVQPSRYEPFGLTVGEALACGTPVVASTKVGSAEGVDAEVCRIFEDGNKDDFEKQVRQLTYDLKEPAKANYIYGKSRNECESLYDGGQIASLMLGALYDQALYTYPKTSLEHSSRVST